MTYTATGRSEALIHALALTDGPVHIVEVGSLRNGSEAARWSDGWSTLTFAEHVRMHGGRVTTIDPQPREEVIRSVLGRPLTEHVTVLRADAATWTGTADVLYLDGPNSGEVHLAAAQTANASVIVCDDVVRDDYGPKAHLVVPWAVANGYRVALQLGRVLVLERAVQGAGT